MQGRRLSKPARRAQLIEAAMTLVRRDGVDRLTLARVAEEAGVSKPIAYDHFEDRKGLLLALYAAFDDIKAQELEAAIDTAERTLAAVSRLVSRAYMRCYSDTGGEWHAIRGALAGSEEMNAVHTGLLEGYVGLFHDALEPYALDGQPDLRLRCIGLVGAAEALSAAMTRGEVSEAQAARTLEELMQRAVMTA